MSSHPINLALRFLLELAALAAVAVWGWRTGDGWLRYALAIGLPLVLAVVWAVFRVPNDPGPAPVATPGVARLIIELAFFGFAAWALYDIGALAPCLLLSLTVIAHYVTSYDRVLRLIRA